MRRRGGNDKTVSDMKRTLIAVVAMCLLPSMGRAEAVAAPETSENALVTDSVQEQIRQELQTIRTLQVEISANTFSPTCPKGVCPKS